MKTLLSLALSFLAFSSFSQDRVAYRDIIKDKAGNSYNVIILNETDTDVLVRLESGEEYSYKKDNLKEVIKYEKYLDALPTNAETGKIEFQQVVEVEGKSKEQIYLATREWFAKTFVSANAVLQMNDKDAGMLVGKGSAEYLVRLSKNAYSSKPYTMYFTLSVEVKDNKYRYTLSDITFKDELLSSLNGPAEQIVSNDRLFKSNGKVDLYNAGAKTAIAEYFPTLVQNLNAFVKTSKSGEDW